MSKADIIAAVTEASKGLETKLVTTVQEQMKELMQTTIKAELDERDKVLGEKLFAMQQTVDATAAATTAAHKTINERLTKLEANQHKPTPPTAGAPSSSSASSGPTFSAPPTWQEEGCCTRSCIHRC